ncbi:SusC/RagA family TonB-linked outer membrane protein [Bacteroides pyogenes]|uniref:SusC/RagA family TonB-linked outer membrane protein n=1 Tax=Bacteroides pyogenes TaxID=310300 RepID=UPI0021CC6E37|nr:SusC/RagA family TonB-linked outer membrane protein [Bacteroides pyogenes]
MMKKTHSFSVLNPECALNLKLPLKMRISIVLLFMAVFQLSANNGYAQRTGMPISVSNVTIEQVLNKIEESSDYVFLYNDKTINTDRIVSVNNKSGKITEILDHIFRGTNVVYTVVDKQIILSTKKNDQQATASFPLKGTVRDSKGEPLIGVNVKVKGAAVGAITDFDGNFSLEVQEGAIVEISYVGYVTQEVKVAGNKPLQIILQEDNHVLNEVVVTALGIKREAKALSYNVQKVTGDELTNIKDPNFMNSLNGKVAGVVINASSAGAGAAARVVMRGAKSVDKDNNALYVIDGIPMFNVNTGDNSGGVMSKQPGTSSAADINPDDIESMSVLTGPSAAALYGSEAANGVILITTKKGVAGKVKVSYSNSTTFSSPFIMPEFQNSYRNKEGEFASWGGKMTEPSSFEPEDFFNTGVNEINSLTLTTGTEKNQTYASVAATNVTGILPNNAYNRYNFSIRNTSKFLNDKLTLDVSAQYVLQNNKNMVSGGQWFNPLVSLYLFPRGESFQEVQMYERQSTSRNIMTQYWPSSIFGTELDMQNPYWIMNRMQNTMKKRRYMFNTSLKWDIVSWMNIVGRVRIDNSDFDTYEKLHASTNPTFTESSTTGFYGHTKQNVRDTYADVLATFTKTFVNDQLSLNANIGASISDLNDDAMYIKGGLKLIPNKFHVGNINKVNSSKLNEALNRRQTQSVFGNIELGWDHFLYLTLTGRNDWSSNLAFTPYKNKGFFYPSVGLSTVISEVVKLPKFISYLKVRGSWAKVGMPPSAYLTRFLYEYNEQLDSYNFPAKRFNSNLKPEETKSWEFGLNTKFLNNRINLDATIYRAITDNQVLILPASAGSGYTSEIVQGGSIRNQGIELGIGYSDTFNKVKFSTNLTYTLNRNKIISLTKEEGKEYYPAGVLGLGSGPAIRLYDGGTMGDLYINSRLRQSPNGYIWRNPKDGSVEVENTDYRKIGSVLPNYNIGWTGSLAWNGLTLSYGFTGRFGGLVVSDTQAVLDKYGVSKVTADARDAGGVQVGDSKVDARNYYETVFSAIGAYYTYDATNVRLSELSLSYQFPKKWFNNVLDMSVGITGKNLWMIYCKAPFDPESTASVTNTFMQGVDYFQQPSLRTLGFNVKLSF